MTVRHTTRVAERKAVAALHWPGWHEWGEPDIAARIAEYGASFEWCDGDGWCEEWEYQRRVAFPNRNGSVRYFTFEGRGHIQPPRQIAYYDHPADCGCDSCVVAGP